jgi:uncharacterized protein YndB with AHSA1/START domain
MAGRNLEVSTDIKADAARLYDMVSDLPQMGRWSPENTGGRWRGGATSPTVGAKFTGSNKSGWRRWTTSVEVTEADPGKRFAFKVTVGPVPIADWAYEFNANGATTTVTEIWDDRRPGWMEKVSAPMMGVPDRAAHNRANMEATLAALKQAAEASG